MPIFEFLCSNCSHFFESIMKPYDPVQCPNCLAATGLEKQISVPAPHVWNCSTEGAGPTRSNITRSKDASLAKKERRDKLKERLSD